MRQTKNIGVGVPNGVADFEKHYVSRAIRLFYFLPATWLNGSVVLDEQY